MRPIILSTLSALAALAGTATGQSFNLDVADAAAPVLPPASFGAFSGQAGFWDIIEPGVTAPTMLMDVSGALTPVEYTATATSAGTVANLTTLDYGGVVPNNDIRALYDDYVPGQPNNQYRFRNLAAGRYRVYTYAWVPTGQCEVYVQTGSSAAGACWRMVHGTAFPANDFNGGVRCNQSSMPPENFVARTVTVLPGEDLIVTALCDGVLLPGGTIGDDTGPGKGQENMQGAGLGVDCSIAGIQIVPVNGVTGCQPSLENSVGGRPRLNAIGPINPNGTFDLTATGFQLAAGAMPTGTLPPNNNVIVWASRDLNSSAAQPQTSCGGTPPPLGTDSVRCLGPAQLFRASPLGALSNPSGVYSVQVDYAALAAQGLVIASGETIHFQVIYEDDPVATDPCQTGPMLRWTESLSLTFE